MRYVLLRLQVSSEPIISILGETMVQKHRKKKLTLSVLSQMRVVEKLHNYRVEGKYMPLL